MARSAKRPKYAARPIDCLHGENTRPGAARQNARSDAGQTSSGDDKGFYCPDVY